MNATIVATSKPESAAVALRAPAPARSATAGALTRKAPQIRSGVVVIRAIAADGDTIFMSGAVVTSNRIATHEWLLRDARSIDVAIPDRSIFVDARVTNTDTISGLALLSVVQLDVAPIARAARPIAMRDQVTIVSAGRGQTLFNRESNVLAMKPFVGVQLARLSTSLEPEMDGAPVLNQSGELVAIAFSSDGKDGTESYAIPLAYLNRMLPAPSRATMVGAAETAQAGVESQVRTRTAAATGHTESRTPLLLSPASFSTKGLANSDALTNMYLGEFDKIDFGRLDLAFSVMFRGYLENCATHCEQTLPANRVMMTRQECRTTQTWVNGYGVPVGPETCVRYETVPTGMWADPVLYNALEKLDVLVGQDAVRSTLRLMTSKDPIGGTLGIVNMVGSFAQDMAALFQMNECASPGMKRLEQNMLLFSQGKQPVRLGDLGGNLPNAQPKTQSAATFKESDYTRLLSNLVATEATQWTLNRLIPGSVGSVIVSARDTAGRPLRIQGKYIYMGINGKSDGDVTLLFSEGVPECVYFMDAPTICRTADRKIVAAYLGGGYWLQK